MTIEAFSKLQWQDDAQALILPRFPSPIIADPSFLFPEECLDGRWHLFAHDAFGLVHLSSADGLSWQRLARPLRNGMRPFIRNFDGQYYLYYEAYRPLGLVRTALPGPKRWQSNLVVRESPDLRQWSDPRLILAADFPLAQAGRLGRSVSNPCIVNTQSGWLFYFSSALVRIEDCGFNEPLYICLAETDKDTGPSGPFSPPRQAMLDPADDGLPGVLGAGAITVVKLDNGFAGLQNKLYTDNDGKSRSALFLLTSNDGRHWDCQSRQPLLAPSDGWRRSHVYACDCRFRPADQRWYLYYNARDAWKISQGRECIGRIWASA